MPVLSRPDGQWTGERGYVQVLLSLTNLLVLFIVCCVFVFYRVPFAFCRMCSQG